MKSRIKSIHLTIIICITIIFCSSIATVSAIDIDNCAILGFERETYTLVANVSTSENICFTITAPNVTLDCGEFSIKANNKLYSDENNRSISSNQPNTIVKNCDKSKENKTKVALFDIISEIVTEPKNSGDDLVVKVSLINFGGADSIDANLEYTVFDENNVAVVQYTKIVSVKTQTEFLEYIHTEGLKNGKYTLKITLNYVGQSFPAHTERIFYIGLVKGLLRNTSLKTFILPLIALGLLIGVYRKNMITKSKDNEEIVKDNTTNPINFEKKNM